VIALFAIIATLSETAGGTPDLESTPNTTAFSPRTTTSEPPSAAAPRDRTDSPWLLVPNPVLDPSLAGTTMVWNGVELLYVCIDGVGVDCIGGWAYDPNGKVQRRLLAYDPGRRGQTAVWTGEDFVAVRGITTAYDPFSVEWRTTTPAPELGRSPIGTWTGSEVIFYGSSDTLSASGTAYDPASNTWRNIAPTPLEPVIDPIVAWSGSEMYVVGGYAFDVAGQTWSQLGAAYERAEDRWRSLPPLPGGRTLSGAVGGFVHDELIIVGVERRDAGRESDTEDRHPIAGFAYSPATDTWRDIEPPRASSGNLGAVPGSMAAVPHGRRLAVYFPDRPNELATMGFYDASADSWTFVNGMPLHTRVPSLVSGELVSGERFVAYLTDTGTVILPDVP
jgi:hypothetical protein